MKHSTLTMFRRVMALSLALLLVVGLTGCFGKGKDTPTEPVADPTAAPTTATEAPTDAPTEAATEAPTEPPVKGVMGTVSANNLNVRSNPSTDSTVLSQLPVNLRIEVLEQKTVSGTNWGRIGDMTLTNGTKISGGWLNLHYVKLDNDESQTSTDAGTSTGTSTGTTIVDPDEEALGTITAEQLQIRKGAGTTYDAAGSYKKGDRVKILEQKTVSGTTWGRTEKGWISMTYVKLDGSAGSAVDTGTNIKQPGATTPTTGSSSGTGTGTGSTTAAVEVSNNKTAVLGYVVVDCDGLTLRTGPGKSYKSLGTADEGDRYPYYQISNKWYRTSHGWLSNADDAYLYVEGTVADDAGIAVVTTQEMYVRQGPGTNFKSVTTLKKGESLAVLGRADGWGYTRLGWINIDTDYVSFTKGLTYTTGDAEVIASSLNVRETASASAKDLGSLKKGDKVKVLEISSSDKNWGKVEYATGKYGWIHMNYVKMTSASTGSTTGTKYSVSIGTLTSAASDTSIAPSTASCTQGTQVTLYVTEGTGVKLKSITVTDANGNNIAVTGNKFTMPGANVTVTAEFIDSATVEYTASIGTVTENCAVSVKGSSNKFVTGATVELNVTPAAGYELDKLTYKKGTDAAVDINTTTKSFTMPAGDVTIDATFKKINYTVTITSGTGGTAGVDKTTANINDVVTISVTASEGYELDKIEATGGVTVGSDKKFTMGNANVTINVTFKSTT